MSSSVDDEKAERIEEDKDEGIQGEHRNNSVSEMEQHVDDQSSDSDVAGDAGRALEENSEEIVDKEENENDIDSQSSDSSDDLREQRQKLFRDGHNHHSAPAGGDKGSRENKGTNDIMANGGFGVGNNPAHVRSERSAEPTSNQQRRRRKIAKAMQKPFQSINEESGTSSHDASQQQQQQQQHSARRNLAEPVVNTTQYKLQASRHYVGPQNACDRIFSCMGCQVGTSLYNDAANSTLAGRLNNRVIAYLHWSFRSSFAAVFVSAALGFLALTMFFALIIWALGIADPSCIGGVDFTTDYFTDAYALSWTTFSTVSVKEVY